MTDNSPRAVVLRYFELYEDGTPESYGSFRFIKLLSEDLVYQFLPSVRYPAGQTMGRAAIRELDEQLAEYLRDRRHELHDTVAEGERVAVSMTWSALCIREFGTIPAQTRISQAAIAIFRVQDGLITQVVQLDGQVSVDGAAAQ